MPLRIFESDDTGERGTVRRVPFSVIQAPVAVGGTSTQSAAFAGGTRIATIQADENCHILIDNNPTATAAHFKIGAGETHDFEVQGGHKLAVITA